MKKLIGIIIIVAVLGGCSIFSSGTVKTEVSPLDVPLVLQYPELPRGCEVTSLAMLLQYSGYDVDKMDLSEEIAHEPFEENGLKGDMHKGFVGAIDTLDRDGLGVYVEPIVDLAKSYAPKWKVKNLTGKSMDALYEAIGKGYPVWVITNARFKELSDDHFKTWETEEGTMQVTYRQHSVVMTGYDEEYVYVNDPMKSKKNVALNRADFEAAWVQMGSQAMYIAKK
ncbi:C39 family peptidase [Bacillus massiliigorillae]|uniref:C39 family peptidase n=1 Tax=Bacillus massiliigorillae TaxID=1243664 RepID=UPI00039F7459|nr:C39 family peptidase [Bacillus massiliigorillae]